MNYNKTLNLPRTKFSMKANLSNREPGIQKIWEDNKVYEKLLEKNKDGEKFILHDGPPYANGHIHLGHALNRVLKDIVLKYKAMKGYYTPFVPGWDCHGLPVEYELLKQLDKKEIKDKVDFRKKAAQYALKFVNIQKKEFKRLGLLGDWDNPYLTLLPEYEEKIIDAFKELYVKGFISRELKPVYWCSSCKTALAEAEVEYKDVASASIYVKFELLSEDDKAYALVWTTTPWTLPSNVALCFHPDFNYSYIKKDNECLIVAEEFADSYQGYEKIKTVKGRDFEGCEFKPPFGKRISKGILGNFVTLDEGTGIVHIAPGHGEEDYLAGKKYDLPILSPVDDNGRFTSSVEINEIIGKGVFESDPLIIDILRAKGILFEKKDIQHSYPHCWRCKKPIIFRATKQWFLKVDKDNLRNDIILQIDRVMWIPEISKKRICAMISSRPDWCLSRQRLWGVPIPVFYCKKCSEFLATEESLNRVKKFIKENGSDGWFKYSSKEILGDDIKCKCGSTEFIKEGDILDVWFDSGVSSFAVLETSNWPSDMYLEGSDQHRGWFQSSIIPAVAIRNIPPYKSVFTHGFVVDAEGRKMSKSIGNVISPKDVVQKYGADLLRLWVASENYFKDIKISGEILEQAVIHYRRIRNTIRFILGNISDFNGKTVDYENLTPMDKFILHKFYHLVSEATDNYDRFLFFKSIRLIHDFCNIWLSSFYFNILKDRLYVLAKDSHERRSSQTVLKVIGEILLRIISPVLSHTAEEGWQVLKDEQNEEYPESVFLYDMPDVHNEWNNPDINKDWEKIIEIRTMVLKKIEESKDKGIVKDPLESEVTLRTSSEDIINFLKDKEEKWKEYFIVSSVKINLNEGEDFLNGKINIDIKKAKGTKCIRCWLVSESVGTNEMHPELCKRCADIVEKF